MRFRLEPSRFHVHTLAEAFDCYTHTCPPSDTPPACPSDTTYFIVTNGDNEYDRQYIPRLLAAPPDTDIIALDFYSRYEGV